MRLSWRLGMRVLLVLVALTLAWRWIGLRWNAKSSATKPIAVLSATMPMNQAGGGVAPADAYEVYSVLYQAPMDEALAFGEGSVTDIPQVDGNCLKPTTANERTGGIFAVEKTSGEWKRSAATDFTRDCSWVY
jgi:hypothetical protein